MKYYQNQATHLIIVFLLFILLSASGCMDNTKRPSSKPNFILIVTDDLDLESTKFMPKLLAQVEQKGVTFTNAFVTSPVCAPSRGSILTGLFPGKCKVTTGYKQLQGEMERRTIAPMMKKAGYNNVLIGKYINGYGKLNPKHIPEGWDEWYALTVENKYFNYQMNENGRMVNYGSESKEYNTDVLAGKAVDFIERNSSDQHFFMFINTVAPHVPGKPAPRHATEMNDILIQYPEYENDLSDKPDWVRNYAGLNQKLIKEYFGNRKAMDKLYRDRWRTLQSVDDMIGIIISILEQNDLLKNTYIIITSDNGDGLLEHIPVSAKLSPYEKGIKIPFYIIGPGLTANTKIDHLVSTVDILPTLADLAGASPYYDIDGRSLAPLLDDPNLPQHHWRNAIFAELSRRGKSWPWKSSPPSYQLMRTKDTKYIEYETGEREYYDLVTDPEEMENMFEKLSPEEKHTLSLQLKKLFDGEPQE